MSDDFNADESGSYRLTKAIKDLEPRHTVSLPPSRKNDLLIGAIRDLAQANLRLYRDSKRTKQMLGAIAAGGALLIVGLATVVYFQVQLIVEIQSVPTITKESTR